MYIIVYCVSDLDIVVYSVSYIEILRSWDYWNRMKKAVLDLFLSMPLQQCPLTNVDHWLVELGRKRDPHVVVSIFKFLQTGQACHKFLTHWSVHQVSKLFLCHHGKKTWFVHAPHHPWSCWQPLPSRHVHVRVATCWDVTHKTVFIRCWCKEGQ